MVPISKKLETLITNFPTCISDINKQCKFGSAWNLYGQNVTIFGFIASLLLGYFKCLDTPLRFSSFVIVIFLIISVVTLLGWNRSLIQHLKDIKQLSEVIVSETSSLQERHKELARQHEKIVEKYEELNNQTSLRNTNDMLQLIILSQIKEQFKIPENQNVKQIDMEA